MTSACLLARRLSFTCIAACGILSGCNDVVGTRVVTYAAPTEPAACSHDCLGGACVEGRCQPITLKSDIAPAFIALDQAHVFWTDVHDARIGQLDKDGSAQVDLVLGHEQYANLGVDGTDVYFNNGSGDVLRCKVGGCGNAPTTIARGPGVGVGIGTFVVDDGYVYWSTSLKDASSAGIFRVEKTGANRVEPLMYYEKTSKDFPLLHMTGDSKNLYVVTDDGGIRRIGTAKNDEHTVVALRERTLWVLVDGDDLVFSSFHGIRRVAKNATKSESTLITPGVRPFALATSQGNLYWLEANEGGRGGKVLSCPLDACSDNVSTIAVEETLMPISLAVDDAAVYWSTVDNMTDRGANGSLKKIAKP